MGKPLQVFCCYAHNDQLYLYELKTHLMALQRQSLIEIQADIDIIPGTEWERGINRHLDEADIILLLISADFIASDYCFKKEMQQALVRHEQGTARVIPVIIRPTTWRILPLSRLQALPKGAKAVTSWQNRDEAWTDVAEGISKVIAEQEKRRSFLQKNTFQSFSSSIHQVPAQEEQIKPGAGSPPRSHARAFITASVLILLILASIVGVTLHQSLLNVGNVAGTQVVTNTQTSYVPSGWKLALSDPLNKPFYWQSGSNAKYGGSCQFSNGAYHILLAKGGNFFCQPPTNTFSNLVIKVNMTIIQGDCGGIWFRGHGPAYLFQVCQNGQYALILYGSAGIQTLLSSASPAIHTGLKQSNSLAVVAIRTLFDFYVNQQKIASINDSTLSSGEVNFGAIGADPTEVAFRTVEVWTP